MNQNIIIIVIIFGLSCNQFDRNIPLLFQIENINSKDICKTDSILLGHQLKRCKVVCFAYDSIKISLYKLPCNEILFAKADVVGNYISGERTTIFDGSEVRFLPKADTFVIVPKTQSFTHYLLIDAPDPKNQKARVYYFSLDAFRKGEKLQVIVPYSEL